MIDRSKKNSKKYFGGLARNGDMEAIYLEWISGRYNVRMLALPEEYYCPQVVRNVRNSPQQQYTWSTSWTNMGKLPPYRCKTVHGHNYPEFARRLTERLCTDVNILFVTAYRDIGRSKWRRRPRSNDAYSSAFSQLRQA